MDTRPYLAPSQERPLQVEPSLAQAAKPLHPHEAESDPITLDLGPRKSAPRGAMAMLRSGVDTVSRSWDERRATWLKLTAWAGAVGHVRARSARDANDQQD